MKSINENRRKKMNVWNNENNDNEMKMYHRNVKINEKKKK
jgi:hypothetical protein